MMDNTTPPEASAEAQQDSNPAPRAALLSQPSTWSGIWVLLALAWLTFARGSFRKLG